MKITAITIIRKTPIKQNGVSIPLGKDKGLEKRRKTRENSAKSNRLSVLHTMHYSFKITAEFSNITTVFSI